MRSCWCSTPAPGRTPSTRPSSSTSRWSLTGLALTKLDGTAKGGVIFALAKQFGLPIRYIGVGEGIDDLRTFEADAFVQALFAERENA